MMESEIQAELIFGIVAAIGTPLDFVIQSLQEDLKERKYETELLHLSKLMDAFRLTTAPPPSNARPYDRFKTLIRRGDELRDKYGPEALALLAASHITSMRPESEPASFPGKAFVLRQLKHPEEVYRLRSIYEDGFHVIGLYCPLAERRHELKTRYLMNDDQIEELIRIDEYERPEFGQRFRDTFHLSDAFIAVSATESGAEKTKQQLTRFLDLLFDTRIITPTRDEYAMYLAHAAALRSASLARQVGASIVNVDGDVLGIGSNEVPKFGGGSYWETDPVHPNPSDIVDGRDHVRGNDSNDEMQRKLMAEVLHELDPNWGSLEQNERSAKLTSACDVLKASGARIMNLTEFGRAVHAEMSALMAVARVGISVRNSVLYSTTFPCHGCTKHIVDAGIQRVVYVEPYPKSLAADFHSDSISIEHFEQPTSDGDAREKRVKFEPFVGIAPRRYDAFFSMRTKEGRETRRKNRLGELEKEPIGLRLTMQPHNYVDRESLAAKSLQDRTQRMLFPGGAKNEGQQGSRVGF